MGASRVGVFGGTFDPVHVGHLVAAVNARHALALDRVLMVVANAPWQKADRTVSPAPDRLAMVAAAVEGIPGLEACSLEIERGGPSYTADTLQALREQEPGSELFLMVGADLADELHTWERIDAVRKEATLVVVNRPGWTPPSTLVGWRMQAVEIPALSISSTDLRARAADGRPLDFLIPAPVVRVIRDRGLYA
ncbi:MAG TPA: nicotinate-nucleotide adenylyltransferase [Acidimicrobiales bacterium]|nr:nicotinate-nucleotide adenylyltransferase [Acidimicrobiales bacterium]